MPKEKWIQNASNPAKEGSLHKQLNVPKNETIPKKILYDIEKTDVGKKSHGITVTPLIKHRVQFAINVQKRRK